MNSEVLRSQEVREPQSGRGANVFTNIELIVDAKVKNASSLYEQDIAEHATAAKFQFEYQNTSTPRNKPKENNPNPVSYAFADNLPDDIVQGLLKFVEDDNEENPPIH